MLTITNKGIIVLFITLASGQLCASEAAGVEYNGYGDDNRYALLIGIINRDGFPELVFDRSHAELKINNVGSNEKQNAIVNFRTYYLLEPTRANMTNYYQDKKTGEIVIVNEVIFITKFEELYCGTHKYATNYYYIFSGRSKVDGKLFPASTYPMVGYIMFLDLDNDGKYETMTTMTRYSLPTEIPEIYVKSGLCPKVAPDDKPAR